MDFGADLAGAEALFGAGDCHGAVRLAARCFEAALREACRRYLAAGAAAPRVRDPSTRQRLEGEVFFHPRI